MRFLPVRLLLVPVLVSILHTSACELHRPLPAPPTADAATPALDAAVPGDGGLLPDLSDRPDRPDGIDLAVTPDLPSPGDLSRPPDSLPAVDAAVLDLAGEDGPDLATPPDLAVPRDLALPRDSATSPDFAAPPDLMAPGDLATPPDLGGRCGPSQAPLPAPLFAPVQTFPLDRTFGDPDSVAIGDVTGDGRNDVVVTFSSTSGGTVEVRPQMPNGQLGAPLRYTVGRFPLESPLAIGDLNGDGRLDVVIGQANGIGVMLQDAQGALIPPRLYPASTPYVIAVGDFNQDGLTDVASLDWAGPAIEIHRQDPKGALLPLVAYPVPHLGFDDLAVGDVNGDGLDDLVVSSLQSGLSFPVLLQQGDGTLSSPMIYPLPDAVTGIAAGDVTGDCRGDVVVTYGGNRPYSFIATLAQNAGGRLSPAVSLPSYDIPSDVAITDVDGDGAGDVVVVHTGWYAVGVYRQLAGGTLATEERYGFGYINFGPLKLVVGDINGDGRPDVVSPDYGGLFVLYHR